MSAINLNNYNNNQKKEKDEGPLLLVLDSRDSAIEDFFTKAPEKTAWSEDLLNRLKGASGYNAMDYLDKIDPLTESQLKAIFPNATATQMLDPLKPVVKTRLHDNIRRDPSTFRGLLFLDMFLLGKEIPLVFDVNRKFANAERREQELKAIESNPDYLDIMEDIMNRDDEVDIFSRMAELVFSAEAFGRSVQVKKYDKKGLPCELIPLSSPRLGRVWVDKKTWHYLGVEYLDYPKNNRILLAKDIIHNEVNDFHITPNSRYFGIPSIESTMAIGERNRSANEIAIPEIMRRMFAPIMLVKSEVNSHEKLQEIKNKWRPGKTLFINDTLTVESIPLQHDLDKIQKAVMEGSKDIYRGLTVPLVVGFQDEQNRATAEGTLLQWYESVLEFKRRHLNNLMWRQWYKPQLEKIFEDKEQIKVGLDGGVMDYLLNKATNPEQIMLPFRIKMEFSNVVTTPFLDKSKAILGYFDRKIINDTIARTEGGYAKYENDMQAYKMETERNNAMNSIESTLLPTDAQNNNTVQQQGAVKGINKIGVSALETKLEE